VKAELTCCESEEAAVTKLPLSHSKESWLTFRKIFLHFNKLTKKKKNQKNPVTRIKCW